MSRETLTRVEFFVPRITPALPDMPEAECARRVAAEHVPLITQLARFVDKKLNAETSNRLRSD